MRQGPSYENIIGYVYIYNYERHFVAESKALTSFSGLFRRPLRADNGRKWDSGMKRRFYGGPCIYCNSTLTRKNGNRINTYQRCRVCSNIFSIPALKFKLSNLLSVSCPHCSAFNEIKLGRSWSWTEADIVLDFEPADGEIITIDCETS